MKKTAPKRQPRLQECERNGVRGWKHGADGFCFIGNQAKQKAFRAEAKRKVIMWREEPKAMREAKEKKNLKNPSQAKK